MFVKQISPLWCIRVGKMQKGGELTRLRRVVKTFVKLPTYLDGMLFASNCDNCLDVKRLIFLYSHSTYAIRRPSRHGKCKVSKGKGKIMEFYFYSVVNLIGLMQYDM